MREDCFPSTLYVVMVDVCLKMDGGRGDGLSDDAFSFCRGGEEVSGDSFAFCGICMGMRVYLVRFVGLPFGDARTV